MNFPSHAKSGLIAGIAIAVFGSVITNNVKLSGIAGLLTFVGAIFPDLDTESIPSRWAARIGLFGGLILLYFKQSYPVAWAGILFFLVKSDKHRGFAHKYPIPAVCFVIAMLVGNWLYACFGMGVCLHFWVDKISLFEKKNWR